MNKSTDLGVLENADMHLHVAADAKELVVRTGEATPIELPEPLKITGMIDAPRRFVEKRVGLIKKDACHVEVCAREGKIILFVDEQNLRGAVIAGYLKQNKELIEFGINKGKKYGLKELSGFIRMRRFWFPDKEQHRLLIENLSRFAARVDTEIKAQDDRKGHTLAMIEKKVTHEIPLDFKLCMPLFDGRSASVFAVEILADITDGGVQFWLESVELEEMLKSTCDAILEEELKAFADYVVVQQ